MHSISGDKYGHKQKGECDQWQVTIPLSKYDHLDVTGIVEDGVHAKVDASLTFVITPVGLAVRKVVSPVVLATLKKQYTGIFADLANQFLSREIKTLIGDDLVYMPQDANSYVKQHTFDFDKYDDGWKVSTKEK